MTGIKKLIICGPYEAPSKHWKYDRTRRRHELVEGRRPAGFLIATPDSKTYDDPGIFQEIELVNHIRSRVDTWRKKGYPGITGMTRELLEFWHDRKWRKNRLFFCQLEAIETLIWLAETPQKDRQGINIPSDGGQFERWCCKMATGTGKTVVMAMLIAWQVINKATYTQDARFSRNILVMAPGLTVKSRLQALHVETTDSIYEEFDIVPDSLREKLLRANIAIHNWHTLVPEEDSPRSVVRRGAESNHVFARRILGHDLDNIIVINDEAHHAYRAKPDDAHVRKGAQTEERDRRWIEGLDKINEERGIMRCFDFSATPFVPSGKNVTEDMLFDWIVSDFSLNDAIESGLTKTPKVAISDDSSKFDKDDHSRFYHIYMDDEVKPDLNRNAKPYEKLPDLVANAYMLLGQDWRETETKWKKKRHPVPPVMITVCNKTNTAARVMHAFENNHFEIDKLSDPEHLLHIDSTTIRKAEEQEMEGTGEAETLRKKVDTVGKVGKPGEQIRNIVAVQMLSEGWDARNVTHIMGLRAFSSQLLCEQVIGRGLRRMLYETGEDGHFPPEYVNVFGVPFTFLPHEEDGGAKKTRKDPPTIIEIDPSKARHEISWPNVDRIDAEYLPRLEVDWTHIESIRVKSDKISTMVDMAMILAGKTHKDKTSKIDLERVFKEIRQQRIVFVTSKNIYSEIMPAWHGTKEVLLAQIIPLVDKFICMNKVVVTDAERDTLRAKLVMLFNMQKIVKHVCKNINDKSTKNRRIHLNEFRPEKSTSDMRTWHTKKPTEHSSKSHTNLSPYDSNWELAAIQEFERNTNVTSWVKNDHIGFVIKYLYNGIVHDYWPDFLVRLKNNITLVLEIKGKDSEQDKKKRSSLAEWVDAVNDNGNYGTWVGDVAFSTSKVKSIISKYMKDNVSSSGYAKCPKCFKIAGTRPDIEKRFGFRNMNGITRPQSWCKSCRAHK